MGSLARSLGAVALLVVLLGPEAVSAGKRSIKEFFGNYKGETITAGSGEVSKRDLNIRIEPYDNDGFTVIWGTVLRKRDGSIRRKIFAVSLKPSRRPGIYSTAIHKDQSGKLKPLDLLAGEPYVWAAIDGDTLTLRALYIDEDGGYEIQVFQRTLSKDGLHTHFERIRNGQILKVVEGTVKKASD